MTQPLVSVQIIIYNMIDFVHETLTSALEQDYDNLEVIAADDGSTDGTTEIIREYARKYPGRLVHVHGPNLGIEGNCNRALQASRGNYVAYQGGDDVLLPGKIRRQVQWMEEDPRRILCGHDVEAFDNRTGEKLYLFSDLTPMTSGVGADWIVRHGVPFAATSVMLRAASIPAHGLDPRVPVVVDWPLYIGCLASGGHFGYVDGIYARYRRHESNVTKKAHGVRQDDQFVTLALVESRYPHLLRSCQFARARLYRTAGMAHLRRGDVAMARKYWSASLTQWVHWQGVLAYLLTFVPAGLRNALVKRYKPALTA